MLILKQSCALCPEKKGKKLFQVDLDASVCFGENCGCNKLCTRVFKCPGLPVGSGRENRPHRRGDLLGLRRVRIHLPVRGHHEKGGGITWQPKHLQQTRTT